MTFLAVLLDRLTTLDRSTVVLSFLSLFSLLVIYLQHRRILPSPFVSPLLASSASATTRACTHCHTLRRLTELKACSQCRQRAPELEVAYFCGPDCQRANWRTHKLVCGSWKNLEQVPPGLPPGLGRADVEALLQQWCDFHKHLLIFATIHALDLPRSPSAALSALLMVTLVAEPRPASGPPPIARAFAVEHVGALDVVSFRAANPGMANAFVEMDRVRTRVAEKGGLGAAMLLVRCGPVVQVIPVGLPSQKDLDSVRREKDWRAQFDTAIKAGIKWNPATRVDKT